MEHYSIHSTPAFLLERHIPAQTRSTSAYIHTHTCNKLEAVLSSINGLRAVFALEVKHWNLDVGSVVLGR